MNDQEPISMERITSMIFLPMQERTSVSDALLPSRNVGAVLSGTGANERTTWAVGLFNDWIDTHVSFDDSRTLVYWAHDLATVNLRGRK